MPDTVTVIMVDTIKTNWADVADRAIDAGTSAVAELSELVKGVAPEVWEIAMRQVYADAIGDFIGFSIAFIFTFLPFLIFKKKWLESLRGYDNDGMIAITVVGSLLSIFFTIASVICGVHLVKALINPSYYAIKLLADMV